MRWVPWQKLSLKLGQGSNFIMQFNQVKSFWGKDLKISSRIRPLTEFEIFINVTVMGKGTYYIQG